MTADGDLINRVEMPTLDDGPKGRPAVNAPILAQMVRSWAPSMAFVEFVSARPTDGPGGAFAFGRCRGVVEGVLSAAGIPVKFITPACWKLMFLIRDRPMAEGKYVSYLRVSTQKQGASGLGLEAQRNAVEGFLNGGQWTVIKELVEIESGKRDDRPKLAQAMQLCRIHGATLVIAKLDRLSRDAHFLLGLQKAGIQFVAADQPFANELTIGLLAVVAQHERKAISARTKAALAAKSAWYKTITDEQRAKLLAENKPLQLGGNRGKLDKIGDGGRTRSVDVRRTRAQHRASDLMPTIVELRAAGFTSLAELAGELTARGIPTARGASTWSPMQVSRVLRQAV